MGYTSDGKEGGSDGKEGGKDSCDDTSFFPFLEESFDEETEQDANTVFQF